VPLPFAAAANPDFARSNPPPQAKTTEVKIYSELLTDRHSSLTEKLKAATELGNQALGDAKEDIADGAGTIEALVSLAKSKHSEQAKERAAGALRNLAVESWKNKEQIASAGGIPPLVAIAETGTTEAQVDFAVGALASLALDSDNKKLIAESGGIPVLVAQVRNGHTAAIQTLACIALGNLTSNEVGNKGKSNKMLVAEAGGIEPLVDLAATGMMEQREAAVGALWNLAFNDANKKLIAAAGGIPPLVDLVARGTPRQKEQAAGALANLTCVNRVRTRAPRPFAARLSLPGVWNQPEKARAHSNPILAVWTRTTGRAWSAPEASPLWCRCTRAATAGRRSGRRRLRTPASPIWPSTSSSRPRSRRWPARAPRRRATASL
jgi:hypothetical protein